MKDRDTLELFPSLDNSKVKRLTDAEKYDRLIVQKYQTDLFKKEPKQ